MNPYLYLFKAQFNGYMIIVVILIACYFIRVRNLYTMEHYKGIIDANKKNGKKENGKQNKKSHKSVKEGFESQAVKPIKINTPRKSKPVHKEKLQNLQPHYETRLDSIYKRIEDRYDNSEHKLVEDYNKVYNEYLEEEKNKALTINPIQSLTEFEDTIYDMIDEKEKNKYNSVYIRKAYAGNIASYFDRDTIPIKGNDLTKDVSRQSPPPPILTSNNIIEGFANSDNNNNIADQKTTSIQKLKNKKNDGNSKKGEDKNNKPSGITIDSLLTGDTVTNILQFGLDNARTILDGSNISSNNISNFATKEDNMMPLGILMIIASLLLYFADLSS